ncbi:MAG: hypothetical protein ACE5ID_08680, partial [Acidobacteriota bacterium]
MVHGLPQALDARQVARFQETGFLILPSLFTPADVKEMRAAFQRLEKTARALTGSGVFHGSRFVLGKNPA